MSAIEHVGCQGVGWLLSGGEAGEVFTPEDLTAEQRAIARAAAEFVEGEVLPRTGAIEALEPGLNQRLLRDAGRLGLLGLEVPEEYGGLGLDLATSGLVSEQIGRQASFAVTHGAHSGIGTLPLVYFGSEEQKRKYLPRIAAGDWIAAFALSEAEYGSDALGAATRAVLHPDGTHYVLNGSKMWISNAGFADVFTLFAQVEDPEAAGRTFSAFLVERTFPGVSIGREEHKLGIKGSSTCRVILEDARVPAENLLHSVGRGHVVALNVLNAGRLKLAMGLLGACRDLVATSSRYANERRQMGRPISSFGLIQHKLAEQVVRLFAVESACYRTAGMVNDFLAAGTTGAAGGAAATPAQARALEEFLIECAILKVLASEALDYIVDEAVQIHGGYGYTEEFPVARAYRDARINRIFEGTNEINRLTIGATILRRSQGGRLSLAPAFEAARNEPAPSGEATPAIRVEVMRRILLRSLEAAIDGFGARLADEQEVLGCLADMAIDIFAAESVVLRHGRLGRSAPGDTALLAGRIAEVFTTTAAARVEAAARQALAASPGGPALLTELEALFGVARQRPNDTIAARRAIAARVIVGERYPFAAR